MSIQDGKVLFYISKRRNAIIVGVLMVAQVVLSVVLTISLAGNLIWPENSSAAAGAPLKIAYEGRLTDSSGNALGGTGTLYCYRFSIYDSASAGAKLWPGGTPSNTTATTTDGVFNAVIGQSDTLTSTIFDFSTTSVAYLQVEVNTVTSTCGGSWEALLPRQQVLSSGYAMQSANVYGSLLKTDTTLGIVQVGAGGQANPVELALDTNNTTAEYVGQSCSTSGYMWYNSVTTQALICENGLIEELGTSGTTTIAAINANSGTPASVGTINFNDANGVTFGIAGNTITASVNAGGGNAQTLSNWPTVPTGLNSATNNTGTSGATGGSTQFSAVFRVAPMVLDYPVTYNRANLWISNVTVAGTGSGSVNRYVGVYTLNGGTALSLLSSFMFRHDMSQNSVTAQSHRFYWGTNSTSNSSSSGGNISANYAGMRAVPITTGANSFSAGKYWIVYGQNNITGGSNVVSGYNNMFINESQTTAGQLGSAATISPFRFLGVFSSTTNTNVITAVFMPSSVNTTAITNTGGTSQQLWPYINLISS